jgi:hypothetical protein
MQNPVALQQRTLALLAPAFWGRHRRRPADFIRECVLTFPVLMLLVLQKSLKSLLTHAQEFFWQLRQGVAGPNVSAGAVTHARAKLRASAFVELNQGVLSTRSTDRRTRGRSNAGTGIGCWAWTVRWCACPATRRWGKSSAGCSAPIITGHCNDFPRAACRCSTMGPG